MLNQVKSQKYKIKNKEKFKKVKNLEEEEDVEFQMQFWEAVLDEANDTENSSIINEVNRIIKNLNE